MCTRTCEYLEGSLKAVWETEGVVVVGVGCLLPWPWCSLLRSRELVCCCLHGATLYTSLAPRGVAMANPRRVGHGTSDLGCKVKNPEVQSEECSCRCPVSGSTEALALLYVLTWSSLQKWFRAERVTLDWYVDMWQAVVGTGYHKLNFDNRSSDTLKKHWQEKIRYFYVILLDVNDKCYC